MRMNKHGVATQAGGPSVLEYEIPLSRPPLPIRQSPAPKTKKMAQYGR